MVIFCSSGFPLKIEILSQMDDIHSTMLVEFTFDEYYGEDDCDWVFNTATGYDQTDLGTKYDI